MLKTLLRSNRLCIRHQMLKEQKKTSQGRVDLFIQKSLKSIGRGQLAKRLEECSRGQYCGNIYCRTCRDCMADKMNKRYQAHIQKQNMDKHACRERLRFITILHQLIPADKHQVAKTRDMCVRSTVTSLRSGVVGIRVLLSMNF